MIPLPVGRRQGVRLAFEIGHEPDVITCESAGLIQPVPSLVTARGIVRNLIAQDSQEAEDRIHGNAIDVWRHLFSVFQGQQGECLVDMSQGLRNSSEVMHFQADDGHYLRTHVRR